MRAQASVITTVLLVLLVVGMVYTGMTFIQSTTSGVQSLRSAVNPTLQIIRAQAYCDALRIVAQSLSGSYSGPVSFVVLRDGNVIATAVVDMNVPAGGVSGALLDLNVLLQRGDTVRASFGSFVASAKVTPVPWLCGYARRMRFQVRSATAATDYQVHVLLDTNALVSSGQLRPDCADIRVTLADGVTEVPFWFNPNTCETNSTSLWVRLPELSPTGTEFFVYYGNSAATDESNADAVFVPLPVPNYDFTSGTNSLPDVCPDPCPVTDWNCFCRTAYPNGEGPERLVDLNYPWTSNGYAYQKSSYWNHRKLYVTLYAPKGFIPAVLYLRTKPYVGPTSGTCYLCGLTGPYSTCGQMWYAMTYTTSPASLVVCRDNNCVMFWWLVNGASSADQLATECNIQSVQLPIFNEWRELIFDGDILIPRKLDLNSWSGALTFTTETYPGGGGPVDLSTDQVRIWLRKYGVDYNVTLVGVEP